MQESIEKIPPQNVEAEIAVLGSMLLDHDAISQAVEILNADYFYKDSHRKIFSAMLRLFDDNKAIDIITVMEELKKTNSLDEAGGPAYISGLASAVPTTANFTHYAKIVKEKMLLRSLITTATQIVTECYDTTQEADTLVDKAEQRIFDVTSKKVESRFVSLREVIKDSIETIDGLYQRKENVTGIATG